MQVYLTDTNGFYLAEKAARQSPLEPGVYLIPARGVTEEPPTPPEGKAARYFGGQWRLVDQGAPVVDLPNPTEAELLAVERASMNPPKAAFMEAAFRVPSYVPSHENLLETFDAIKAGLGPRNALERWDRSVTVVVRLHPDMAGFAQTFRLGGEKLDALCRFAIAYDADPTANFTDQIAAFNAIDYEAAP